MTTPLITERGAYEGIEAADYHGNPHLLPGPSLSSSGAKTLLEQSPAHFWHASPMNPEREEKDADHFAFGRAGHDLLLLGGGSIYQFTPCSARTAYDRRPRQTYQLPPSVAATIPPLALPSNDELPGFFDEDDEPDFAEVE